MLHYTKQGFMEWIYTYENVNNAGEIHLQGKKARIFIYC